MIRPYTGDFEVPGDNAPFAELISAKSDSENMISSMAIIQASV